MLVIKKLCALILILSLLLPGQRAHASSAPDISAERAVLMHESGRIVFGKSCDSPAPMASTTKLMTALLVLEEAELSDRVKIREEYCLSEGSSMYLRPGEEYSVEELLKGLLLVSGNDAALALACHTAGSEAAFVALMNRRAQSMGLKNTHFSDPHGLSGEEHYSSASDLARIMAKCMEQPAFREISALKVSQAGGKTLINHNRLLSLLKGCDGGKTGYTCTAGRCLVSTAQREGCRYYCVSLNAPDDWNDHIRLYNWAFSAFKLRNAGDRLSFTVPVISGKYPEAGVIGEEKYVLLPKDALISVRAELPFFVFAPVRAGDRAGRASVFYKGEKIAELELYYKSDIPASAEDVNSMKRSPQYA